MSHFAVAVITPYMPTMDQLTDILQPWHEYECTGTEDQYVIEIDETENIKTEYDSGLNQDSDGSFKENYPTLIDYALDYHGMDCKDVNNPKFVRKTNPSAKWDWWVVGGRYTGYFKMKPDTDLVLGEPGAFGNRAAPGHSDQALLGNIDIEGMRDDAGQKAAAFWDEVREKIGFDATWKPWQEVLEQYPKTEEARTFYWSQPPLQILRTISPFLDFDQMLIGRQEYVKMAEDGALTPFAVVKDGQWYERGKMGWWAVVSDEKDKNDWNNEFSKLINSLESTACLTIVDCHI